MLEKAHQFRKFASGNKYANVKGRGGGDVAPNRLKGGDIEIKNKITTVNSKIEAK
jgi:hypothetical protein